VSKTALLRLSDLLTAELTATGVIVIDLSPGLVRTAMTALRPDADRLPPESWTPATAAAGHVEALLSGRYDVLTGPSTTTLRTSSGSSSALVLVRSR
jgi:short-subunit dehydrogenase